MQIVQTTGDYFEIQFFWSLKKSGKSNVSIFEDFRHTEEW